MNNETSNQMPQDAAAASPEAEPVKKPRKPRAAKAEAGETVAEKKPAAPRKRAAAKPVSAKEAAKAAARLSGEAPPTAAKPARKRVAKPRQPEVIEQLEAEEPVQPSEVVEAVAEVVAQEQIAPESVAAEANTEQTEAQKDFKNNRQGSQHGQRKGQNIGFADVVSGDFDDEEENGSEMPAKRVLAPQVDSPKLHKVLAQAGMGSRLEMEQLILEGRISVNNEPAHVGQRIQFGDVVKVNGQPIRFRIDPPPARVIAYHKPVGEVVTHDDPQNRPTVFRKLPKLQHGKWQSVGRLDLNTEGLLLFTSSGELANSLMHPRFGLEREYAARVLGALSKEEKQRLLDGVQLEDGEASFGTVEDGGGEGANCWYRVTISEGRNREVRRMFEAVGHAVSRLIRIRYGAMMLPRGLKRGAWVELDQADIQALMSAAGVKERAPVERNNGGTRGANNRGGRNNRNAGRGGRGNGFNDDRAPQGRREGGGQRRGEWDGNRPAPSGMLSDNPRDGLRGNKGANKGGNRSGGAGRSQSSQPDPMRTSVGYIGGDSLSRARQNAKRRPGGGGGGGRRGGR
ncbi:rRNA pseudouridine synthase [Comamonas testosteroni]|uniref:Pseudouridine synthase n=1 Tax=Comamonas testosteroni TaxID=285 RepID=A0A373FED6_COMTE|nr:pseudouridine synthase [Comamonas testosteroni]RGE42347.1 rRNA pseudouridine synthase [Comamonas testosteroni]